MRVFILGLGSSLTDEVARLAQDAGLEVVGTVATRAQVAKTRRRLLSHPSNDHEHALSEPVAIHTDKTAWTRLIQRSDVVVASLVDDAKLAIDALRVFEKPRLDADENDEDQGGMGVKRFIALSSVLTWSRNPPLAKSEDGSVGHREDDFKTRKPAPAYAELKTSETQVLTARRSDELETCVVASGLQYGGAQSALRMLFRDAWMHPTHPLLVPSTTGGVSGGLNLLPMIGVYDLALVLARLASTAGPGGSPLPKRYIVAVDHASRSTTLRDICVGVSTLLGNGQVRDTVDQEEADALLLDEEDGPAITPLQLNLSFDTESDCAVDQLVTRDEWQHRDGGLLAHLPFFVKDFVRVMDLRPLKTVLLGAPRAGKSTLAERLVRKYHLPLLTPQSLLHELFASDVATAASTKDDQPAQTEEGEGPVEPAVTMASVGTVDEEAARLREQLEGWRSFGSAASDATPSAAPVDVPEAALVALLRWKLRSAECRNQGYVLDGLPVTLEQAKGIFERIGEQVQTDADNAEGGDGEGAGDPASPEDTEAATSDAGGEGSGSEQSPAAIAAAHTRQLLSRLKPARVVQVPNRVIMLNAPRELLERRAQEMADSEAEASGNTQEAFARRLEQFEAECERVADFFERRGATKTDGDEAAAANDESSEGANADENESKETEESGVGGVEVLELHLPSEAAFRDEQSFDEPIRTYMEQGGAGAPFNFHPTREELRQREREFEAKQREDDDRRRREAKEVEEGEERDLRARLAADKARLELLEREEAALLEARAKPLRAYLMDTVLPALTEGMLEVVKVQPEDPIDYLAEFLFRKGQEMESHAAMSSSG